MDHSTSAQVPVSISQSHPLTRLVTNEGVRWDLSNRLVSGDHWYWVRLSFSQTPRSHVQLRFNCGSSRPTFRTSLKKIPPFGFSALVKFPYPCEKLYAEVERDSSIELTSARVKPLSRTVVAVLYATTTLVRVPFQLPNLWQKLKRTFHWGRQKGLNGFLYGLKCTVHSLGLPLKTTYQLWCENFSELSPAKKEMTLQKIQQMSVRPTISVVIPTYRPDHPSFIQAVNSVRYQLYPHWQLCIVDDASNDTVLEGLLEELEESDRRIQVIRRRKNGHISAASNTGLEYAKGDYVVFLDHDDELSPDALYWVAQEVVSFPTAELIYSDEDKIDDYGRRFAPHFKPDWDLELMYSFNLITHLAAFRTSFLKSLGGFRVGFEGSQDYDLFLRASEQLTADKIRHIPRVLYHWRNIPTSTANRISAKNYALDRSEKAIEEHLERRQVSAKVVEGFERYHAVKYALPDPLPAIDLYLRGKKCCDWQQQLQRLTDYPNVRFFALPPGETIPAANPDSAPVVGVISEDLIPTRRDWLLELISHLWQPGVGVVGGKILSRDHHVASAGLVLDLLPVGLSAHAGITDEGYLGRACTAQELSAVSPDCLFTRRSLFHELRGFDPVFESEPLLSAADYCLRVKQLSHKTIWTPGAQFIRPSETSPTEPPREEAWDIFSQRWKRFGNDPHYSPNLSRYTSAFVPAFPPRLPEFQEDRR